MQSVISALTEALKTFFHPKMLSLVLWPMLVAVVLWVAAALFFWGNWIDGLNRIVQATPLEQWMSHGIFAAVSHYLVSVILVLLLLPAIYVTALLITSIFAMPMMVNHVATQYYPELELKKGGSTVGSLVNAMFATVIYCAGWVLSLPLWLFSPLALVVPIVLMAYLNQRLFRYDALAEHASKEEFALLKERATVNFYLLGLAVGLLQFVPLLNLFLPVYTGLAFIHLCMAELRKLRQTMQGAVENIS